MKKELRELKILEEAYFTVSDKADDRISRLRSRIKERTTILTAKYEHFDDYISPVKDHFDLAALTLRYLYGMTWRQVAFSLGEYDEQYARRRCEKYYL